MALVLACVLPILAVSVLTTRWFADVEREVIRNETLGAARAVAATVDLQLLRVKAQLAQLAALIRESPDQLGEFYQRAQTVAASDGTHFVLSRTDGTKLFNTRRSASDASQPFAEASRFAEAVASGEFTISDRFISTRGEASIALHLPVAIDGQLRYVLTSAIPVSLLHDLLAAQRLPPEWQSALIDRNRVFITDHRNVGSQAGRKLPDNAPGPKVEEGFFLAPGLLTPPLYIASVRSKLAGWQVTVGIPQTLADAPLWRSLSILLGIGGAALMFGLGAAFLIGRRISRAMRALSRGAFGLVDFQPVPAIPSSVTEIGDIATALQVAGERLASNDRRLRRTQHHLARAQEIAAIGSFEHDLHTGRTRWSRQTFAILGRSPESFDPSPENFLSCVHPDDQTRIQQERAALLAAKSGGGQDYRIVRPDGEIRYVHSETQFTAGDSEAEPQDNEVTSFLGTLQDVTEHVRLDQQRHELEAQLHQAHKLEALGTLAGGIAHDLNNTLVPILGLTKMVRNRAADARDQRNLDTVLVSAQRARDLVRQILAFSRKEEARKELLDLAQITRDALKMLRATIPSTIQIEEDISCTAPVFGDATQFHQVIINLLSNASQAIGSRTGRIAVTLGSSLAAGERRVLLSVADDGCGMSEETRRRIFEPFFTTKGVGEGTGLGLSVVHGIVKSHDGRIDVDSTPGAGTRFTISLPTADAAPLAATA